MKQRWKRRLSFVVVLAMMIGLLSVGAPVVAQTVDDGTLPVSALPSSLQLALDDTDPTARVVERESLFEVETRTADGHGKIEQFAVPIKYIDEDGKQQYIDTAMEPLGLLQRSFGKYDYKNAANSFTVRYSEDAATGLDFDGDFTTAVANPYQAAGDAYIAADAEAGNKLVYPDAFGEYTAVEYINGSRGIKENIILERYTGQNTFSFVLKSDTLTPSLLNGGEAVQLTSAGSRDAAYIISPLYVYDSYVPGAVTDTFRHHTTDCHYELQTLGDGEYLLTYVVDAEWLASPNVVWPVTVDPSINTTDQSLIGDIADSHVVQGNPGAYYYGYNSLRFGYSESTNTQRIYSFIDFNTLPTLTSGAYITDVQFWARFRSGQTTFADGKCFLVSSDRNFNSVNWNNQPSVNTGIFSRSAVLDYYDNNGTWKYKYYQFPITQIVRGWYDGTYPNYGLRFGYEDETVVDSNTVHSSEATYATSAPKLIITYESLTSYAGIVFGERYYLNNHATGHFLHYNAPAISSSSGLLNNLSTSIQWVAVYAGNGYFMFQNVASGKYLCGNNNSLPGTYALSLPPDPVPHTFMWEIVTSDGYIRIQNRSSGRMLYNLPNGTMTALLPYEGDFYNYVWRIASVNLYNSSTELSSSFNVSVPIMECGGTVTPIITKTPSTALFANPWDFSYSASDFCNYNSITGNLTGALPGTSLITVTHKVTGQSKQINITTRLSIGLSLEGYGRRQNGEEEDDKCGYGARGSLYYGNNFANELIAAANTLNKPVFEQFRRVGGLSGIIPFACREDFVSKSSAEGSSITKLNVDDVNLMIYIGHGIAADRDDNPMNRNLGNYLHFSKAPDGSVHVNPTQSSHAQETNQNLNFFTSEARFGAGNAKTKWVIAYTCNFLNLNNYVDEAELKNMLAGAHMVLGYATPVDLSNDDISNFGKLLGEGKPVIYSFFISGNHLLFCGENHQMRVVTATAAKNDTLFNFAQNIGPYPSEACEILASNCTDNPDELDNTWGVVS